MPRERYALPDVKRHVEPREGFPLMKKILIVLAIAAGVAGCNNTEKGAVIGGASGALIGGLASGDAGGAIIGGIAGTAVGALIGNVADQPGKCYYRGRDGRRYIARC